ncbi:L-threonylcarbamoyladenylate synthase [Sphingomonas montanisoli]|uniref:Threonylcarbamoyl-AMP synthase n=1 Tax=Sphingomonas montanisoli TaxID=2606412 RepID=A0A5D9CCL8_9SPHN|nr:L-threonylcarbamoyladenylate synthase [Sphingomonas montanisoli]TZG28770.1 threonylcarbamoyl-AMP synthase [Sphingomonas montanisoli]
MITRTLPATEDAIAQAARLIAAGEIVAVPTETVYGLAGDATSGEAVAAIYAAKGRPSFNPLILHVADRVMADRIAAFAPLANRLADRFWPGPLTMVLPLRDGAPIASLVTAGLSTVAIRMPAHPVMRALIASADRPLAAPSANASGSISPTRAEHVARTLDGRLPLILDAGATEAGVESTIVAVESDSLRLLRPGPITAEMLAEFAPVDTAESGAIEAPGQLASHYAPSKPVRLDATTAKDGEYLIGFGPVAGDVSLSAAGDLQQAAARLFDLLHIADASPAPAIAVAPIPHDGLGAAINDRLNRAAAPRP